MYSDGEFIDVRIPGHQNGGSDYHAIELADMTPLVSESRAIGGQESKVAMYETSPDDLKITTAKAFKPPTRIKGNGQTGSGLPTVIALTAIAILAGFLCWSLVWNHINERRIDDLIDNNGTQPGPPGPPGPIGPPGNASFTFAGVWNCSTTYVPGQYVQYQGQLFLATGNSTCVTPGTDPNSWVPLTPTVVNGTNGLNGTSFDFGGDFNNTQTYPPLTIVTFMNVSYYSTMNTTGVTPGTNDTVWVPLVGQAGPPGPQGLGFIPEGSWQIGTSYDTLNIVTFNNQSYYALQPNVGSQPDQNPSDWQLFSGPPGLNGTSFTGGFPFNNTQVYPPLTIVTYNNVSYYSTMNTSGVTPGTNNTVWVPIIGQPGPPGPPGLGWTEDGNWNNTASYPQFAVVNYSGIVYFAVVPNTNVVPGTDPSTWFQLTGPMGFNGTSFTDGGTFNNATVYPPLTVVTYNGTVYFSASNTTGVTPGTNSSIWVQISGSDGQDGLNGLNGTGFFYTGNWNSSAIYTPFQVVNYTDGFQYFATDINNNAPPSSNIGLWMRITGPVGPQGLGWFYADTWNSSAIYTQFQVVNYSGISYFAIMSNVAEQPDINPAAWFRITGPIGFPGQNGTNGIGINGTNGTGFTYYASYNNSFTYPPLSVITVNNVTYFSTQSTTGVAPGTNPAIWTRITGQDGVGWTFVGNWNSTAAYTPFNVVNFSGTPYVALTSNTNVQPGTDPNVWQSLVGPQGINGTNGIGLNGTGFFYTGNWNSSATYTPFQVVNNTDGYQYFATVTNTNTPPASNPGTWFRITGISGLNGGNGTNGTGFQYVGDWNSVTQYIPLQVVTYLNISYYATVNNSNVQPDTNSTTWIRITGLNGQSFTPRGNWSSVVNYIPLDIVSFNGSAWITLVNNTNVQPGTNESVWQPLGADAIGQTGDQGQSAFTFTNVPFIIPNPGSAVIVSVLNVSWAAIGETVYIPGAGYFNITAIPSTTSLTLVNEGAPGSGAPGATINSPVIVTPAGSQGFMGINSYSTTTASFVMPAALSTVTIQVNESRWAVPGQVVYIGNAGYFNVSTVPSSTSLTLVNLNYSSNVLPGTTVQSGSGVTPGGIQGPSGVSIVGPPGAPGVAVNGSAGRDGQNAFTITTAGFTMPAVGSSVTVSVVNGTWPAVGQVVFIATAGYFVVNATGQTSLSLENLGTSVNAAPSSSITSPQQVSPSGLQGLSIVGPPGTPGVAINGSNGIQGQNAYTFTTAAFTMPAVSSTVTVSMINTSWFFTNQILFVESAGYFQVSSISPTSAVLTNLGYTGNTAPGTLIGTGRGVSPGGLIGTSGGPGTGGQDAFTVTTASFTVPAANVGTVTISVVNNSWVGNGQVIYIAGAGYYRVLSKPSITTIMLTNLGYAGNAAAGTSITSGASVQPGGIRGTPSYTNTTANFVQPAVSSAVLVNVQDDGWMALNEPVFIAGGGMYTVAAIINSTTVSLTNLGYSVNAVPGATVSQPALVTPGGLKGDSGAAAGFAEGATVQMCTTAPSSSGCASTPPTITTADSGTINQMFWYGSGGTMTASSSNLLAHTYVGAGIGGNTSGGAGPTFNYLAGNQLTIPNPGRYIFFYDFNIALTGTTTTLGLVAAWFQISFGGSQPYPGFVNTGGTHQFTFTSSTANVATSATFSMEIPIRPANTTVRFFTQTICSAGSYTYTGASAVGFSLYGFQKVGTLP